jgi:hypothetical protein
MLKALATAPLCCIALLLASSPARSGESASLHRSEKARHAADISPAKAQEPADDTDPDPASDSRQAPPCMSRSESVPINDEQALQWKVSTPNQFKARGHISGVLVKEYPEATAHGHMQVRIGPNLTDTIEVIYNEDFGAIPQAIPPGAQIEACGDYITSNEATPQYKPSPDGALIHWLHRSPRPESHDGGFLIIDGSVYGQGFDQRASVPQPTPED